MSSRFEKVRMSPDGSVQWLLGTYKWGQLFFDEAVESEVRAALRTLVTAGGQRLNGAKRIGRTEKDGELWRLGNTGLKHYTSLYAPDALNATKANVTLGAGLRLIDAEIDGVPLRTPTYYALARPNSTWFNPKHDGVAMAFIEGRRPTPEEFEPAEAARYALYSQAVTALGGKPTYYMFDDEPRNFLLGNDGIAYKLDIDLI